MTPRVAVLQLPGVNCEAETAVALERAGLDAEVFRWTRSPRELGDFAAYVIPGGFSYQDRVRAGALAAKDPLVEVLADEAERGKPVLGICNGAQILVEAGLVPGGGAVELALARNRMPGRSGYYARWVWVRVERTPCLFLSGTDAGRVFALPVAHGEGRFVGDAGRMASLDRGGQIPLRYAESDGRVAEGFPANPNGAEAAAAAVCNAAGNVLALMPHPERAIRNGAVPRSLARPGDPAARTGTGPAASHGAWDAPGPGLRIFEALRDHLREA